MDWTKLPSELEYLIEPSARYGEFRFPDETQTKISSLTADEKVELASLSEKIDQDWDSIARFQKSYRMKDHSESAQIHFLLHFVAIWNDAKD